MPEQKFYFKTEPECVRVLFGLVPQRTVPGTQLLCSGFWGLARSDKPPQHRHWGEQKKDTAEEENGAALRKAQGKLRLAY